ncbi:MAG: alpha/beta hydrolase [Clostridia bacterium]|nr:alpha/beta hydrolase [Clostridia bacterium]
MTKKFLSIVLCIAMLFMTAIPAFAADSADLPYENSRFFSYGDYELHYRVVEHEGLYKGRIMFIHGFGQSSYSWENMADEMSAKGYDCYCVDLPNFGYSTRENADMELIDRETLVEKLMLSIAPEYTWTLAGHSMGGAVAINVAQQVDVQKLMLFCAAPVAEMGDMGSMMSSPIMSGMLDFVFKYLTKIDILMRLIVYMATANLEFTKNYNLEGVTAPLQLDGTGEGLCMLMQTMRPTDLEGAANIDCPVLIVNAEKDMIINDSMKQQISDAFPSAEHYLVEGGGHICIEDRAEELANVAYDFLNK